MPRRPAGRAARTAVNFVVPKEAHKFLVMLSAHNETTITEIFHRYIRWLAEGNPPIGFSRGMRPIDPIRWEEEE